MNKVPLASRIAIALITLSFLHVSTYSLSFTAAIDWVQATDACSYLAIARAAPALPVDLLPYHFAQRWVPHYLVGLVAGLPGLGIERAYVLAAFLLCLAIFCLSLDLLLRAFRDRYIAVLIFLLLALSPFAFRLFVFVPELLADLVFVLGLAMALRGLTLGRLAWVVAGMAVETVGKQMSLLLLPGVLLFTWCRFGAPGGRMRAWRSCLAVLAGTIAVYVLLLKTSAHFALPNSITGTVLFALFPWLHSDQFSSIQLAEHLLRILMPLIPFIGIVLLAQRRFVQTNGAGTQGLMRQLFSLEKLALLLMLLGPMAYAFLPGPKVQMGNQSRYIALAFLPTALLVARLLPDIRLQLDRRDCLMLAALLAAYSYHHRYTLLQATPSLFLAVHLVTLLGLLLWFARRLVLPSVRQESA
jgi:hypothetical protein